MFTNLKRIIKAGFVDFWRSGFLSFAAIVVLTLCLLSFGAVMFADVFGRAMIDSVKSKVDITVYFNQSAQESDILALQKTVNGLPDVASTTYVSSDQAMTDFQNRWQNNSLILDSLNEVGNNPFPAELTIQAKEPSEYAGLASFLNDQMSAASGTNLIDSVNYSENQALIDRLGRLIPDVEYAGLGLAILLVLVAVIVTFNTIRLVIYTSRDEISVMRLVGASNTFVRGPFVVSGVMCGIVSGILTLLILAGLVFWSGALIARLAGAQVASDLSSTISIFSVYFISNFGQIFAVIMGAGIILGAISSYLAVRRYLKV
ncbi:MAG: permease-like cell division protein FtsX [Terriglobales bacterium]